jgi:hypothetical protein
VFTEPLSDEIQNTVNPDTLGLDAGAASTDVLKQPDPGPLDSIPAGDGEILARSQSTRDGGFRDARDVCGDAIPVNGDSEAELSGGVGDRESGMGAPRKNSITRSSLSLATPHTGPRLACDFRISEAHGIGVGSLGTKLKHNLEAIQTLKGLEAENRPASPEEQARLVRYCGWGALPQVFLPHPDLKWRPGADALQELLTPEELESAKASTPNAHYTSPGVVRWIWDCLIRLGVCSGIQVLEPACGIGHFFGLMPECLLASSSRTGVELEPISARIAQKLYPGSLILAGAFERAALPDNFYDVVIGNVPFANVPVFDPIYRRQPALTRSLHDYFLVRSIDRARPKGLIALITSAYSMDKREQSVRKHIAHRATLIAAQRLPNTTFEQNAGTSVTTDLLIFQKL